MNENNKTFQTALKIFNGSRMKDKLNDSMSNITLKETKLNNYCFFIDGICSGLFIDKLFVDEKELKELGWKVTGRME